MGKTRIVNELFLDALAGKIWWQILRHVSKVWATRKAVDVSYSRRELSI